MALKGFSSDRRGSAAKRSVGEELEGANTSNGMPSWSTRNSGMEVVSLSIEGFRGVAGVGQQRSVVLVGRRSWTSIDVPRWVDCRSEIMW